MSLYNRVFHEAEDEAKPKRRVYDVKTRTYKPEAPVTVGPKKPEAILKKARPLIAKPLEPLKLGEPKRPSVFKPGTGASASGLVAYLRGRLGQK